MSYCIEKAKVKDVEFIYKLLLDFAKNGLVLPRSYNQIYENLRDFFVCFEKGKPIGCCALHIFWKDLAEIRSLVVLYDFQGKGYGKKLVESCIKEAVDLGIDRVFALTSEVDFFRKSGFREIEKDKLPQKVWSDCLNCVKFPNCDEVCMIWQKDLQ